MKKFYVLFLMATLPLVAQIPSGYYSSATGTGYTLKTQLHNKIKNHTNKGYSGLWTTYATSDRDKFYENDNTIMDMYSEKPTGKDPYTYAYGTKQCGSYASEGSCYNREHIIPQSVFNSASPMVADAHFIPPTDGKVNGQRANYPHGTVATASWTSLNGSKLGTSAVSGYSGTVFEPIDEFKGDIARMYFYFATRYENTVANYTYPMFDRSSNKVFTTAFLNTLLSWHNQDPVSAFEIARNNAIYVRQNNRNPFIDNPQYVNQIWGTVSGGGSTGGNDNPTLVTDLYFSEYIEGSSNNKALEITNAMGVSVNLAGYVVKKQTNGAGSWSTGINLAGNLASNGKFVIVNSAISTICFDKSKANISTSASEMTFNGNDAIGLFKNGNLIDIIGNFNGGTAVFSADETLRRKTTVAVPKSSFNKTGDWISFSSDTCSGLTNRSSNDTQDSKFELAPLSFNLYPNPSDGSFIISNNTEENITIEVYSIIGKKVYSTFNSTQKQHEINNLESGIYLVNITSAAKSITKKLIVN